jgi:hypothetical protein
LSQLRTVIELQARRLLSKADVERGAREHGCDRQGEMTSKHATT